MGRKRGTFVERLTPEERDDALNKMKEFVAVAPPEVAPIEGSFINSPEYKQAIGLTPAQDSFAKSVEQSTLKAIETVEQKRARWKAYRDYIGDISTLEKAQEALAKISGDLSFPRKIKEELRETVKSYLEVRTQEEKNKKRIPIELVVKQLRALKRCYCEAWKEAGRQAATKIADQLNNYSGLNLRDSFPEIEAIIYKCTLDSVNQIVSPAAENECNKIVNGIE